MKENTKKFHRICIICKKEFDTNIKHQVTCGKYPCQKQYKSRKKYKDTPWYKLRFQVLNRDNFTCQYCGRTPKDGIKLHIDHIIPKSKNGKDIINNLITSCEVCNIGKMDVLLDQHDIEKIKRIIS